MVSRVEGHTRSGKHFMHEQDRAYCHCLSKMDCHIHPSLKPPLCIFAPFYSSIPRGLRPGWGPQSHPSTSVTITYHAITSLLSHPSPSHPMLSQGTLSHPSPPHTSIMSRCGVLGNLSTAPKKVHTLSEMPGGVPSDRASPHMKVLSRTRSWL